jgi:hypothetical protein
MKAYFPLAHCTVLGFIGAIILWIIVIASGQTFGQRASLKYKYGSTEWKQEVYRLANE